MTIADLLDRLDAWWSRRDVLHHLDAAIERAFFGDLTYSRPAPAAPPAGAGRDRSP